MWIRSQDRKRLMKCDKFTVYQNYSVYEIQCDDYILGSYSTEEKVLKVLDMIQERIADNKAFEISMSMHITANVIGVTYGKFIFEMPQDNEVEE